VLEKLGWHVGKNELLSELVQLGSLEKSDNESDEHGDLNRSGQSESEVDFGGCNLDLTGNSDDCSEAAEGNNLRPIVIDGSNVAMRSVERRGMCNDSTDSQVEMHNAISYSCIASVCSQGVTIP